MKRWNKHMVRALGLAALLGFFASCSGPKTIPDSKLREIFKEVFIANAYVQTEKVGDPVRDSLDIYRPILSSYGYTMRDLEHTLANFSRRKSVRISNVVDQAIKELEDEESWYRYRATLLDTIDMRAQRFYAREVVRNRSFSASRIADTASLRLVIPVSEGVYDISFYYNIDSADLNRGLKTSYEVTDTRGKVTFTNNNWMSARRQTRVDMRITPTEGDSLLTIRLGNYPQNLTTPNLRIDSLDIFFMPTLESALDSMDRIRLPYKNLPDEWVR